MIEDINERMAQFAPSQNDPLDVDLVARKIAMERQTTQPQETEVVEVDDVARRIAQNRRDLLMATLGSAAGANPDQAAQAKKLGEQFGVGADIAGRNMQQLKKQALLDEIERRDLMRRDPILSRYLSNHEFAAMAHDDIDNLAKTEELFQGSWFARYEDPIAYGKKTISMIDERFRRGRAIVEMGRANDLLGLRAQWSPDPRKAPEINEELKKLTTEGGIVGAGVEVVGQMLEGIPEVAETTAMGATAGGAVGAVGGPAGFLTIPAGMLTGAGAGFAAGSARSAFMAESGNSYQQMIEQGYDPEVARKAAIGVGVVNASIEMISFGALGAALRRLGVNVFRPAVANALAKPTAAKALATLGSDYGKAVAAGWSEEFLQEIATGIGDDIARVYGSSSPSRILDEDGITDLVGTALESGVQGAMGMAILGGIGPVANFRYDMRRAGAAERTAAFFQRLTENAQDIKLRGRDVTTLERIIASQAEGTEAETIYVEATAMQGILRQSSLSDEQIDEALPGVREQIQRMGDKEGDVTFPISSFVARLAGTDLGTSLLPFVRIAPNAMSPLEAQEFQKNRHQLVEQARVVLEEKNRADEVFVQESRDIYERIRNQAIEAGQEPDVADVAASLYQAFIVTRAADEKTTPAQIEARRRRPLTIEQVGEIPAQGVAITEPLEQASTVDEGGVATPKYRRAWHKAQTGTPITVTTWHAPGGSEAAQLTDFARERMGRNTTLGNGWYGARDRDITETYGKPDQFEVTLQNPFVFSEPSRDFVLKITNEELQRIRDAGHDGIIVKGVNATLQGQDRSHLEVVAFNPEQAVRQVPTANIMQQAATMDAEYFAAVERGDMATAQRMVDEAAKAAGYTQRAYKAMPSTDSEGQPITVIQRPTEFPAFNRGERGIRIAGFFAEDRGFAEKFSQALTKPPAPIYEVYLREQTPYVIDAAGRMAGDVQFGVSGQEFRDAVRSGKYDSIIIKNTKDEGTIHVALNPNQIKSADPIVRDADGNVIPLSRRFDITSPKLFEQAATSRVSALGAEAARKLRESVVADGGKDVKDITADQVITDERIPTITLQDLVGKRIFPTIADRTAAGVIYTGIDSSKPSVAIEMLGGPLFPLRESNFEAGVVWANRGKEVISAKGKKVAAGADYMIVLMGDADMHKSNTTVANVFFATLEAYVRDKRITKKNAAALTKLVKDSETKDADVQKYIEKFPGLDDIATLEDYLHSISFTARARLIDILGSKAALELGAPSMARILDATREESMAGHRWGDGVLVVKIDKDRPFITLGEGGTRLHPDFPLGMRGQVVGKLDAAVNYELLWQDWLDKQRESKLATNQEAKINLRRAFELSKPELEVTQELVDRIGPIQQGNIDSSRQAMLAVSMALDRWRTSDVAKNKGGASPQGFVDAVANSPANVVLNEYKTEEVKAAIKDGSMSIYQLGDETSGIWFALKKGNPATEYGIQIEGLNDTDVTLTAVVNNEQGARGIGAPAVVLKALQKGATVLDCFAVQSARFPDGFLPTLYREFGFEVVGEVPFEPKYYSKQKLADAEKFWTESGWDKNKYGYPRVVIMKWRGTDEDRAGITERYLRDGIAGVLSGGASANAQAAAALFGGDAGTQAKAAVGPVEGRVGGTERPVAQRSLASRAVGIARDIAALTDNAARNLGISTADRDAIASGLQPGGVFSQSGIGGILEQAAAGPARGGFDPSRLAIMLTRATDRTTMWHELVHFFLQTYTEMIQDGSATQQVRDDMDLLLRWFKIEGDTPDARFARWVAMSLEQQRKHHEALTYNAEIYAFEGKAPSAELVPVFERLRAFMLRAYKSIRDDLNAIYRREFGEDLPILTGEVRQFMDRMLASEEQIKRQAAINEMKPMFQTQEQSGMDDAEWAAYQQMQQEAIEAAVTDMNKASLRQMQWLSNARSRILRDLQAKHAKQRREIREEVAEEIRRQPLYRAMEYLRTGTFTDADGEFVKMEGAHRLDMESVRQMYSLEPENLRPDISKLGTGGRGMMGMNGIDPDVAAELFGFSSGDELIRALIEAQPMKEAIDARTDELMLERFSELSTPEGREAKVQESLHNEARARFVAVELRFVAKATQPARVLVEAARQAAREMIAGKRIADLRPSEFIAAEARAARSAAKIGKPVNVDTVAKAAETRAMNIAREQGLAPDEVMAAGVEAGAIAQQAAQARLDEQRAQYGADPAQALIRAKRAQLYQNQLAAEALAARDEVEKGVRYLRQVMRDSNIKRMGADVADQIDRILERFNLRPMSAKRMAERQSLVQWLESLKESGLEPDLAPEILDEAARKPYREMTVAEFRDLVDAVKQLEYIGKNAQKIKRAQEMAEFEEVRDEIVASVRGNFTGKETKPRSPTTGMGKRIAKAKRFLYSHLKAAAIARIMDGGQDDGQVWNFLIRTANEAGDMETRMRAEATKRLTEILAPVFALGKMGGKGIYFDTVGMSLNREARLVIALNMGNDGNRQRLLDGEGWTLEQVQPILESLTEAEWKAVQDVWDYMESFRPLVGAKERRLYGREPKWVTPVPFTVRTADGKEVRLSGGYYPIKYDPIATERAETADEAEKARTELRGAYTAATTRRSFTKARAAKVEDRPLLYTMTGVYSGINDVIHDIAWHEWLIQANRLMRDEKFDRAVRETYGAEFKSQLKGWIKDVAAGERGAEDAADMFASYIRRSVSAAGLGFNIVSAILQVTGFSQSIVRVGAKHVARGVAAMAASPVQTMKFVNEKSSFMRERARTLFRELNELRNMVGDESAAQRRLRLGTYLLMMWMQRMVDVPTWVGAYEKALEAGKDDATAVALADQAVIDSQGGGMLKDLSKIERGGALSKLFTVFYSYMNTVYNMAAVSTMTPRSKGRLAADYAMLFIVPVVLNYALKKALTPDVDDEEPDMEKIATDLVAEELSFLMGTMVGVREFQNAANAVVGKETAARGYEGPAGLRAIGEAGRFAVQAKQLEFDRAFRRSAINMLGIGLGLPSAQINRTIDGVEALAEGETENPFAVLTGVQR